MRMKRDTEVRVCLHEQSYCGQPAASSCLFLAFPSSTFISRHRVLYSTMARGRSRSGSVASITNGHQARAPTSSPQLKRQFAAAIDSIYHNNLTVLQRKDPTIVSILDSFSHVCLYHFNGSKWEKQGYEGSMFLVEQYVLPQLAPDNPCSRSAIAVRTLLRMAFSF